MSSGGFLASGSSAMISIWLLTWGIRRQGELDHDLDLVARRLRWLMVVAGVIVAVAATRPAFNSARGALAGWLGATAFLAWPNFAYYLARVLRRLRLMPSPR